MIDGANRNENRRGQLMRARVLELWASGTWSTFAIAAHLGLAEQDVCDIVHNVEVG